MADVHGRLRCQGHPHVPCLRSDDAATQFFRRTTQTNLYARFLPIVQKATTSTGVTSTYKKMMAQVMTLPGFAQSSIPRFPELAAVITQVA